MQEYQPVIDPWYTPKDNQIMRGARLVSGLSSASYIIAMQYLHSNNDLKGPCITG
ncbi:hypothetical protein LTR17_010140, partial [Elasticomyces elasticus]